MTDDEVYNIMYETGRDGLCWNRPTPDKSRSEFDTWMMAFIDGLNDGKHFFADAEYDDFLRVLNVRYPEWSKQWLQFIPREGTNT